jgi:hypothetical protein
VTKRTSTSPNSAARGRKLSRRVGFEDREFQRRIEQFVADHHDTPNGRGWLRLHELLRSAKADPEIASSPGALGFVAIMIELVSDAVSCTNGVDALLPLDELGLLPNSATGKAAQKQKSDAGKVPKKISKIQRGEIARKFSRRVEAGEQHGAMQDLATEYATTPKTIAQIVKDAGINRK